MDDTNPSPFPFPSPTSTPFPTPSPVPSSHDEKPSYFWIIGLAIYITGTITMSAGINLQKYALNRIKLEAERTNKKERASYRSGLWLVGLVCYITAGILLSAALYFASPALVSPFMSVVLIANVIFAHFLLGEPFGGKDMCAVLVVLFGLVFTALGAPIDQVKYTSAVLLSLYTKTPFIVFSVCVGMVVGVFLFINWKIRTEIREAGDSHVLSSWKRIMFPFSFAALAGIFGGVTVLMMKSAIEIIVQKISEGFLIFVTSIMMYALVLLMGFFWSMQMYWLNRGLKYFNAIYIVSLEAVINEVIAVAGSIIYFQEYNSPSFTPTKRLLFGFGLLSGVTGVLLLAYWRRQRAPPAPDVMDLHPEQWLDIDEEQEKKEYVMQVKIEEEARRSHRRSGEGEKEREKQEEGGQVSLELGGVREYNEEAERDERDMIIVDDVMFAPDPFTPSPLLMYSIWGVPLASSLKIQSMSHQALPETEMRELSGGRVERVEGDGDMLSEVRSHVNLIAAEEEAKASQGADASISVYPTPASSPARSSTPSRGSGSAIERRNSSSQKGDIPESGGSVGGPSTSLGGSLRSLAKGTSSYSALPQREDGHE